MISNTVDHERKLTVVTCSGKITANELSDAIEKFYQGDPTPNTLWGLEQADLSGLRADDVMKIAILTKKLRPEGFPGKTAIVTSRDLGFGMGRMFETYAELEKHPVDLQVFRSLEEAYAWLDE